MNATDVFLAQCRLRGLMTPTPLVRHPLLDAALGTEVWVKLENTTTIGAFKIRGGLNLIATLDAAQRRAGICAPTRGNHGQALAYAAHRASVQCTLFVPERNNADKNRAMRAFGADVRIAGATFDDAHRAAELFARESGARYVHPGREPALIAGAGTIALEMFEAIDEPFDDLFVPVGVGSLAAGVAIAAQSVSPRTRVHGVCAAAAPAMHDAFHSGELQPRSVGSTIADGLAVGDPIDTTLGMMQGRVASMRLVDETELRNAIHLIAKSIHQLAEGAGAAALAGAIQARRQLEGRRVGVVLSGGNLDTATMASLFDTTPLGCHD